MINSTETTLYYRFLDETPVGRLLLAADSTGLRYLHFADGRELRRRPLPPSGEPGGDEAVWEEDSGQLDHAAEQLDAWFSGRIREFDLALAPQGTPFQRKVWSVLQEIPWGRTVTYGDVAARVGRPTASRAVGLASGRNPISIIIPCHRVIGRNGQLTGYGGGLDYKQTLLELEGSWPQQPSRQRSLFERAHFEHTSDAEAALDGNNR